jgi:hypothetical protein
MDNPLTRTLHFRNLKIAYSWKCNAYCRHCLVDSHAQRKEKLTMDQVLQSIEDAAAIGVSRLEFTGGEIMLFPGDLHLFLERSHRLGLKVTLDTNAFWAKDSNKARNVLFRLRAWGVDSIILSTDSYHTEYIDLDCVRNAIDAAQRVGVRCAVTVCIARDDFTTLDIISRLRRHCGSVKLQNVAPFGRARSMDRSRMLRNGFEAAGSPCGNIYGPLVTPDSRVSLCCAPPGQFPRDIARVSPLILGWLEDERLKDILTRALDDPLLNFFAAEGMIGILQRLNALSPGSYRPRSEGYFGRCDLCTEIFGCPSRIEQIRAWMPQITGAAKRVPAEDPR